MQGFQLSPWRTMMHLFFKCLLVALIPLVFTVTQVITSAPAYHRHVDEGYKNRLPQPKVCAPSAGCMIGKIMPGYRIDSFEAFMGIPYALPPVGDLRFSHPKAYPPTRDLINATEPKSDCIQKNDLIPNPQSSGSEDCLYLNVYRPIKSNENHTKLPVMVYIHQGGWFAGSVHPAIVGPEYFMDTEDVILVTFNYRLGVFGFLSTEDAIVPGNFGLKDQTLALKWVQKNIAAFGGNPQKVTLFGQSAGGVSAHMHMLSKHSEGLFQAVIALSGTANVPFALQPNALELARLTARHCNVTNAHELSTAKLLKALRAVDAETLLRAADAIKYWDVDPLTLYRPVVENFDSPDAFFTENPVDIFERGDYKAVPFMTGVVPGEGAVRAVAILESEELRKTFNDNFDYLLEEFLELPPEFDDERVKFSMESIIREYFDGQHELTPQGFVDVVTDRGFHHPFYTTIETYIRTVNTAKAPLFLYYFNYKGPHSFSTIYSGGVTTYDYGVVHCDDLIYLFRSPLLFPDFEKNSTHAQVSKDFVRHFVEFAKNLKPYPSMGCSAKTYPYDSNDSICDYVLFENAGNDSYRVSLEQKFNIPRMQFWDDIIRDKC
ncbi:juvenile hormone esterase isoform X2 [Musca domestica]|uniref:Carboxylic ester hydrolase n=1 Tax=Musca domestica TaxID=7370 RepID=A0ABM3VMS7_MUSDO|nr:juvenile hormone esterase isoform X2 [Musca domestica]